MTPPQLVLPSFDWEPVYLIAGALLGVIIRAKFTNGQAVLSRETVVDMFVGAVLAGLWNLPGEIDIGIALLSWPPIPMPERAALWQRGLLMAGLAWLFVHYAKMTLIRWAPLWFEKITGKPAPNKNGGGGEGTKA